MQHTSMAPWPPVYLRQLQPGAAQRFVALTWGTRGDVQPFVALGVELQRRGHAVTIAARAPFRALITAHGLGFHELEEDGTDQLMEALARLEGGLDGVKLFITWQRRLLGPQFRQLWAASQNADVLISNAAYTLPALHIAEQRGIPIFQAYFDPGFIPTRRHGLFGDRIQDRGALPNLASTRVRNLAIGLLTRDIVNAWRREHGMRRVLLNELHAPAHLYRLPVLAAWSTALLDRPDDWPPWFVQTGRWHMPVAETVEPRLVAFTERGPAPVYIGFGSWGVHDRTAVTDTLLHTLAATGRRGVLHRNTVDDRSSFPEHVYVADNLPHDWLFPRVDAIVHHGGAGTTGAATTAGVPAIIVPAFFGQLPWGHIIQERGIGTMVLRDQLRVDTLAAALAEVTAPQVRERARTIGARARSEGGVVMAADAIERQLRGARAAQVR